MATTIHALAYKVSMDTRQFTQGAVATRAELREGAKLTDKYKTSMQQMEDELRRLAVLQQKGAISMSVYAEEVNKLARAFEDAKLAAIDAKEAAQHFGHVEYSGMDPAKIAEDAQQSYLGKFRKSLPTLFSLKNGIAGAIAAAGINHLNAEVEGELYNMDRLIKLSSRLNIDANELVRMSIAAQEVTTLSDEQVGKAMQELVKRIGEAKQGTGEARMAIDAMGLSVNQLASQSVTEKIKTLGEAFRRLGDEQTQLWAADKLHGEAGVELVNLYKLQGEELESLLRKADRLGVTWDQSINKSISETAQAMHDMKSEWGALWQEIALKTAWIRQEWAKGNSELARAWRMALTGELFQSYKQTGLSDDIQARGWTDRTIDILSQYNMYRQRYTGDGRALSWRERAQITASSNENEQERVANEMLKELRRIRGISEAEAKTYDARPKLPELH